MPSHWWRSRPAWVAVGAWIFLWAPGRTVGGASASQPLGSSPAAAVLEPFFALPIPAGWRPAGVNRGDYLKLIVADINFFLRCQDRSGAIIDPYQKREIQYSTPAFAVAAAALAAHAGRSDLLQPAALAMTWATHCLATGHAADKHSDFYIPMLMVARQLLKDRVPAATAAQWDQDLRSIDIARSYRTDLRGMNWNIVSSSGELLRRAAGLVAPEAMDAQMQYLEESLANHQRHFTRFGMYQDPNAPLAYDEFARCWLELMMSQHAYHGRLERTIDTFLRDGGLSTLLLLSPTGEWASGGRSAFHNWNEAQTLMICEMEANRWSGAGRADVAGTFKRAAHLALQSMRRWQRPSGELWIVKNHAEPASRLGYEGYSSATQYNLLPMAMLAMAYEAADDRIAEHPTPAETGSYVFDVREIFHKVAAAGGGYYVLIDTAADPHYNATGLQRIMRSGVPLSPLSDSTAADRAYGPSDAPKRAMSPGIQWQRDADGPWLSLAQCGPTATSGGGDVADLKIDGTAGGRCAFELDYVCRGAANAASAEWHLAERYALSDAGVEVLDELRGPAAAVRFAAPALVSDGRDPTTLAVGRGSASIDWDGSQLQLTLLEPNRDAAMQLDGPEIPCHNGFDRELHSASFAGVQAIRWTARLGTSSRP